MRLLAFVAAAAIVALPPGASASPAPAASVTAPPATECAVLAAFARLHKRDRDFARGVHYTVDVTWREAWDLRLCPAWAAAAKANHWKLLAPGDQPDRPAFDTPRPLQDGEGYAVTYRFTQTVGWGRSRDRQRVEATDWLWRSGAGAWTYTNPRIREVTSNAL